MSTVERLSNYFLIFNSVITLMAIAGNCLVMDCILRKRYGLPGYRRFLINLIFSELYLCSVNGCTYLYQMASNYAVDSVSSACIGHVLRNLQLVGFLANLLSLCAMSVDHYLGILHPHRYQKVLNGCAVITTTIFIWVVSGIVGLIDLPIVLGIYLKSTSPDGTGLSMTNPSELTNLAMLGRSDDTFMCNNNTPDAQELVSPIPLNYEEAITSLIPSDVTEIDIIEMIQESFAKSEKCGDQHSMELNSSNSNKSSRTDFMQAFWSIVDGESNQHFCTFYGSRKIWMEVVVAGLSVSCLIFLTACYGRIFKEAFTRLDLSERNFRKLFVTTFCFSGAFAVCYLPFMTFEMVQFVISQLTRNEVHKSLAELQRYSESTQQNIIIQHCLYSLLLLYPILVPLIYVIRMKVFRKYLAARYGHFRLCRKFAMASDANAGGGGNGHAVNQQQQAGNAAEASDTSSKHASRKQKQLAGKCPPAPATANIPLETVCENSEQILLLNPNMDETAPPLKCTVYTDNCPKAMSKPLIDADEPRS